MTARMIVVDSGTGALKRTIVGDPTQFGTQAGTGEQAFAITTDTWSFINDATLTVDAEGVLTGSGAPEVELELIA